MIHTSRPVRIALTIAGSDPIGGAGIQADLKTFGALGVHGVSVVTAITSQNTSGVRDVEAVAPDIVRAQIDTIAEDVTISAVKTGMLATADTVRTVSGALRHLGHRHLVVDPVMKASGVLPPNRRETTAGILLAVDAVSVVVSDLLPLTSVVTPNVAEAARLSGMPIASAAAARDAAKRIHDQGPAAVVIKGGHFETDDAVDLLFYQGAFTEFSARRSTAGPVHGAGCAFAAAIAARLAMGDDIPAAVDRAKRFVTGAIAHSVEIGGGARVLNHFWEFSL